MSAREQENGGQFRVGNGKTPAEGPLLDVLAGALVFAVAIACTNVWLWGACPYINILNLAPVESKENSNSTGGEIRKETLRTSADKHIPLPPSFSTPGAQAHPKSVSN
jgi:hypothetical protein